jgi:hypothetical protein
MIKPLNIPQLSSAKPRSGLQSIADLIPRLIRQYEIQAELGQPQSSNANHSVRHSTARTSQASSRQFTFGWDE